MSIHAQQQDASAPFTRTLGEVFANSRNADGSPCQVRLYSGFKHTYAAKEAWVSATFLNTILTDNFVIDNWKIVAPIIYDILDHFGFNDGSLRTHTLLMRGIPPEGPLRMMEVIPSEKPRMREWRYAGSDDLALKLKMASFGLLARVRLLVQSLGYMGGSGEISMDGFKEVAADAMGLYKDALSKEAVVEPSANVKGSSVKTTVTASAVRNDKPPLVTTQRQSGAVVVATVDSKPPLTRTERPALIASAAAIPSIYQGDIRDLRH